MRCFGLWHSCDGSELLHHDTPTRAGPEARAKGGLDFKAFSTALGGADLSNMKVEVPREW